MSGLEGELGAPLPRVRQKVRADLDEWLCQFVGFSPFVVLGTTDDAGRPTLSPRGGPPGFVRVLDARTLLLPDYAGNKLYESARNLADSGPVGLLFMIPGFNETARMSGLGRVLSIAETKAECGERYPAICDEAAERYYRISIERAYYHCGRGVRSARLWDASTIAGWVDAPRLTKRPPNP